jgi:hypothetical protein
MVKNKRPIFLKSDPLFKKKLEEVRNERAFKKLDKKPASFQELTFRMTRFEPLWDVLKKARFIGDKRGQLNLSQFNIFTIMIGIFVAVILFGTLIYVSGVMNTAFLNIGLANEVNSGRPGYVNMTQASQDTFGQLNNSIQALRLVAITMIFGEFIIFIAFLGFSRKHPILFIVWIFIVFLAVMLAAPISNSYEEILQSNALDGIFSTFTGANWVLLNLPLFNLLVGILGGIFMFINIVRDGGQLTL